MSEPGREPVLAGVDGSASALQAVRWAAERAQHLGRPLRLVLSSLWPLVEHRVPPGVPKDYRDQLVAEELGRLQEAARQAREVAPGLEVQERTSTGDAAAVLIAESEHAAEVVVGSRGLGGFVGMLVGSVAAALAQHAHCPVVVVRAEGEPSGPIVVGVDGSAVGQAALEYAFDAAHRAGAPLLALRTWSDTDSGLLLAPPAGIILDWEAIEQDERQVLAEQVAAWTSKYPDVAVQQLTVRDRPARQLLELGRRARLLVVGSRGRGGFAGMLLGSTSRALLHHAPCPLAIVRS